MTTITVRLPKHLSARVARATELVGTTPRGFVLEAIVEKLELAERRAEFHAVADQRYAQFLEDGESHPWEEVRTCLMERLAGARVKRP